jgi:hypothetical protein
VRIRFDGVSFAVTGIPPPLRQCAGAIYLGKLATEFDLEPASAQLLGQVLFSGTYLKEDGTAGMVQALAYCRVARRNGCFSRRSLHAIADRRELFQVDDAVDLID